MKKLFSVFVFAAAIAISSIAHAMLTQTITFPAVANVTYGDPAIPTNATASSGLPLTYGTSDMSIAIVVNGEIVIKKAGTVTITARQMGNSTYKSAPYVSRTFTIYKKDQTISFPAIADVVFADPSFSANASVSSALPLKYSTSNPMVATVMDGTIKIVGAGTVTITVKQNGNVNYNAATPVSHTFTVHKKDQVITFPPIANRTVGDPAFMAGGTSSSGRTIMYTSTASGVAKVNMGEIRIKGAGTTTIIATLPGTANYNAATAVSRTFSVAPASGSPKAAPAFTTQAGEIEAYPNPVSATVNLRFTAQAPGKGNILVADVSGKQVVNKQIDLLAGENLLQLNAADWAPGIYAIQVKNGTEILQTRVVKTN